MGDLFDILLSKPLPDVWIRSLLFTSFTLHIVFVLLTIGTAGLSLYFFIDAQWGGKPDELRMDKRILRTFMAHKSLAVVLGVAPLLLIQVGFSVPFFIGVYLLAPFWMLITVFLIVAFLSFDTLGHKLSVHRYLHLPSGIIATGFLLVVPALFVAVLVSVENSDRWMAMINNGYQLCGPLAQHWLFRYLHVLGAALVFGAAFHYFFSAKDEIEKRSLLKLIVAGVLVQIILGIMLYSSLPEKPDYITNVSLFVGVIAVAVLLWLIFSTINKNALNIKTVLPILMLILVPMLLTRQFIQDRSLMPFEKKLQINAQAYQKKLQPYNQAVLNKYESDMNIVYDNGETIYMKSCAFCHGEKADSSREANKLAVPPEDISAIRTTRPYLHKILTEGVPGSAMPYFSVFDKYKLDSLIDYLNKKYYMLGLPEPIPVKIPDEALQQTQKIYSETCSQCHGMDGRGSALSKRFQPPPPDFTAYSLLPKRAFDVITKGYSGTAMSSFGNLQEDVRWGLVKIINDKRHPQLPGGT